MKGYLGFIDNLFRIALVAFTLYFLLVKDMPSATFLAVVSIGILLNDMNKEIIEIKYDVKSIKRRV